MLPRCGPSRLGPGVFTRITRPVMSRLGAAPFEGRGDYPGCGKYAGGFEMVGAWWGGAGQLAVRFFLAAGVLRRGVGSEERDAQRRKGGNHADVKGAKSVKELLSICRASESGWSADKTAQSFLRMRELKRAQRRWTAADTQGLKELMRALEGQALRQAKSFNAMHISLIMNAYAAAPRVPPDKGVLKVLEEQALAHFYEPRHVANFVWVCAKLGRKPSHAMMRMAEDVVPVSNPLDIANIMWARATCGEHPSEEVFRMMCERAAHIVEGFDPQGLSNLMWACATLGMQPPAGLFGKLCGRADDVMQDFIPQNITIFVWACATLGMQPPVGLFGKLCSRADDVMQDFIPQDITNFVWACATLGMQPPAGLFGKLCGRADDVMQDFIPQNISNFVWACATLGMQPPAGLFGKLCGRAEDVMQDFIPQNITIFVWACATLGMQPPVGLFGKLCSRAEDVMQDFIPQDITNFVWACATLGMQPVGLFGKLCSRAEDVMQDFIPQDITNFVWACATLGMQPPVGLFGKLCGRAEDVMQDFIPQNITNFVWACATLGMQPPAGLFGKLCGRAEDVMQDFIPQDITNFVWACATLGMQPPAGLFGKLCGRAQNEVQDLFSQGICNMLWSLAVFRRVSSGLGLVSAWRAHHGISSVSFEGWDVEALLQAHQFFLTCDLEASDSCRSSAELDLIREMKQVNGKLCLESFISAQQATPSQFQKNVAFVVAVCGAAFVEEVIDPVSGYSIDILVKDAKHGGKGVAIEVDGPSHFLGGAGGRMLKGSTLLKRRHLEQLGYRAVSVPYWEWDRLSGKAEKEAYVRRLLRDSVGNKSGFRL